MKKKLCKAILGLMAVSIYSGSMGGGQSMGQHPNISNAQSPQEMLEQAATKGEYTFIVFYRDQGQATQQMIRVARDGVEKNGRASLACVQVTDPSMQDLVKRFDVARAPMPLTVAVAPNGAITGIYPRRLIASQLVNAVLPPKMTQCMKSLQENRLVFVCLQTSTAPQPLPSFVKQMQADPEFGKRLVVIEMNANDSAETAFLQDMGIAADSIRDDLAVLLAPPGVMVGKFGRQTIYAQVTSALHEAGKCCDDPNCKHDRSASHPSHTRQ